MSMSMLETKPALTSRQKQIYDFLKDKIRNRGYGPTVREIGTHFGIRSPNGVMCHLKALERKGLITRESHMSRAIQLNESPQQRTSLRLAGQIAAGSPVLAVEELEQIDFAPLFEPEDHYACGSKGTRWSRTRSPVAITSSSDGRTSAARARLWSPLSTTTRRRSSGFTARRTGFASSPPTRP